MYNDPTRTPQQPDLGPTGQQFLKGTPVYDIKGDKVGTVWGLDQRRNTLVIEKGLFFPKDIPVPMSAIDHSDADGVYLNLSKEDVSKGNFAAASAMDTQTSYAGTAADTGLRERAAGEDVTVPVREEELEVGKLREEQGRARPQGYHRGAEDGDGARHARGAQSRAPARR